ncbi:hypothetical protein FHS18_000366 [Paenibacillus phyllosphaerae]|uniref:Uncharacterized protein n=1 Tax=Paenibacillus phyllosphaerae TaxID=274593 RepID=A0A7W5ATE6_9BACL|nr:hypothetical protein [Paenibacillus phyllosphaerae]MBB3108338.1 hypothetical protein [Paenibacillus phyllosphaerae]
MNEDDLTLLERAVYVLDSDSDIMQSIEQSDEDIKQGKVYTTDEVIEQIREGKL